MIGWVIIRARTYLLVRDHCPADLGRLVDRAKLGAAVGTQRDAVIGLELVYHERGTASSRARGP